MSEKRWHGKKGENDQKLTGDGKWLVIKSGNWQKVTSHKWQVKWQKVTSGEK